MKILNLQIEELGDEKIKPKRRIGKIALKSLENDATIIMRIRKKQKHS